MQRLLRAQRSVDDLAVVGAVEQQAVGRGIVLVVVKQAPQTLEAKVAAGRSRVQKRGEVVPYGGRLGSQDDVVVAGSFDLDYP